MIREVRYIKTSEAIRPFLNTDGVVTLHEEKVNAELRHANSRDGQWVDYVETRLYGFGSRMCLFTEIQITGSHKEAS